MMSLYFRSKQAITIVLAISLLVISACSSVQPIAHADNRRIIGYFDSLQEKLISEGFDKNRVRKLYRQPGVRFETRGISRYFVHSEGKLNYDQFLSRGALERARIYMKRHKSDLDKAEKTYGVNKRVITAILLVETSLGTYTGKNAVLNTLSTMAALSDTNVRNMLWEKVPSSTRITREEFDAKADQKSDWAYNELKAFLTYTEKEKINPLKIQGSYAGAMGFCQFMPSNILTLARDGNNDGRLDLFTHSDAIMSIASYLSHYGWYAGIENENAYDVVYQYNHSSFYVNTILKIADALKG